MDGVTVIAILGLLMVTISYPFLVVTMLVERRDRRERDEQQRRQDREMVLFFQRIRAVDKYPNPYYDLLHPSNEDDEDPSTAHRQSGAAHGTA